MYACPSVFFFKKKDKGFGRTTPSNEGKGWQIDQVAYMGSHCGSYSLGEFETPRTSVCFKSDDREIVKCD